MDQRGGGINSQVSIGAILGAAIGAIVGVAESSSLSRAGSWATFVVLVTGALGGAALVLAHARLEKPGQLALLQCCVAGAVYGCVPETDQLKGVGVLVLGILLVELAAQQRLPLGWHTVVTATVFWAGVFGASGRGSAVVGAAFSLWPFVVVAISPRRGTLASGAGGAAAWLVARTGAIQPSTSPAWWSVLLWGGLSLAMVWLGSILWRSGPVRGEARPAEH